MRQLAFLVLLASLASAISAQDSEGGLLGWRQFSLPGLPETEQNILSSMLESQDQKLVQTALHEIYSGAESGRISPLSPEFRTFVGDLVISSVQTRHTGAPAGMVPTLPSNLLVLVDLVALLPEAEAQRLSYAILSTAKEPLLLLRTIENFGEQGKVLSIDQSAQISSRLRAMAVDAEYRDERIISKLTWYMEKQFLELGRTPREDLVRSLLQVAEAGISSSLRSRIYDTLLLLFQI